MAKKRAVKHYVGVVDFSEGVICVTDPCYKPGTWCRKEDVAITPGKYDCFAYSAEDQVWGYRIRKARIVLCDAEAKKYVKQQTMGSWESIAYIGVDAGLAGFFNNDIDLSDDGTWYDVCDSLYGTGTIDLKTSTKNAYLLNDERFGNGFFTRSGFGDGEYGVYAVYKDEKIVAVEVRF